jgi:hypothetical protein
MNPKTIRVLRALFYAYVAFTFLHIAYIVYCEPFAFDAWNVAVDSDAKPFSVGRFFGFWHKMYTSSNPRIGQPMAYLAYKLAGVGEIGTPLAYLSLVLAGFVIGTGRFPKRESNHDLAVLAIGIGVLWFVAPNFPAYLFCRAYATNYVWVGAIQLWFIVVLRLLDVKRRYSPIALVGYLLLGVIAGMGNEHVGPTLVAFTLGYGVWMWRRRGEKPPLLWAGAIGLVIGYALIFFAPGQSQRYEGLAEHYTVVQQLLVRGLSGNVAIYIDLLQSAGPLLVLMLCMIGVSRFDEVESTQVRSQQRSAMRIFVLAFLAASLVTITVFASPKLGPRFYLHSMFFMLAAGLGIASTFLRSTRALVPFVVVAVVSSGVAAARTIPMFTRLRVASHERLAQLAATPVGTDTSVEAWEQVPEDWWFLGDDMRDQKKQELVAKYFGLHRVLFRGGDNYKLLGRMDVKPTYHYEFADPRCMDEIDQLALPELMGRDIAALHHSFMDAITQIQRFGTLETIDLTVTFLGSQPPMPAKTLYLARWDHGAMEGYTARLKRKGRAREREIVVDANLKKSAWKIYLTIVGQEPRLLGMSNENKPLTYVPSGGGQYWTLACKDDYCFIVMAVVHAK